MQQSFSNAEFTHMQGRLDAGRANQQSWWMAEHSTSEIAVRDCRIRLMRGGSGDPLLYLHGASGAAWLPVLQKLSEKYDVIAPEHPGFGESDTPDWLDTIHDLAYFYLDVMEQLKLRNVHLVGNSLGGWLAAEIAVRNTSRLASVTLCNAAGLYVPGAKQSDSFMMSEEQRLREFFYDPKKAEEMVARVMDPEREDTVLKNRATVAKLSWQPRSHDPHLPKWLHRIDVPALVIWGDHDKSFPKEHAQAYHRAIPGSKLVMVPKCGHVPQIEKPDEFVAALESFISARKQAA
jgi:pimeloyl-ACP methyl ester carboxylesterase